MIELLPWLEFYAAASGILTFLILILTLLVKFAKKQDSLFHDSDKSPVSRDVPSAGSKKEAAINTPVILTEKQDTEKTRLRRLENESKRSLVLKEGEDTEKTRLAIHKNDLVAFVLSLGAHTNVLNATIRILKIFLIFFIACMIGVTYTVIVRDDVRGELRDYKAAARHILAAKRSMDAGNVSEAIGSYNAAFGIYPNYEIAYSLALAQQRHKQYLDVLITLEKAKNLNNGKYTTEVLVARSWALIQLNRLDQAAEDLERVLNTKETDDGYNRSAFIAAVANNGILDIKRSIMDEANEKKILEGVISDFENLVLSGVASDRESEAKIFNNLGYAYQNLTSYIQDSTQKDREKRLEYQRKAANYYRMAIESYSHVLGSEFAERLFNFGSAMIPFNDESLDGVYALEYFLSFMENVSPELTGPACLQIGNSWKLLMAEALSEAEVEFFYKRALEAYSRAKRYASKRESANDQVLRRVSIREQDLQKERDERIRKITSK